MDMHDNNNDEKKEKRIVTLRDLYNFVSQSDLLLTRKAELRSALKKADRLTSHGMMDQSANLKVILVGLGRFSPAMAGVSPGGYANLKARVRAAFKLAMSEIMSVRDVELNPTWRALQEALDKRHQHALSRFLRFCSYSCWLPEEIADEHLERYRSFLDQTSAAMDPHLAVSKTIRAWNSAVRLFPSFHLKKVTAAEPKRVSYWISRKTWSSSLNIDVDEFLNSLKAPTFLKKSKTPKLKATTVDQYGIAIVTVVSALVALGDVLANITSLAQVVSPTNVERAVIFLHERFEGRVTSGMEIIAARSRRAATWCKLPDVDLAKFDDLLERINIDAEPRRGMTQKNQTLVERLDDPRFRDLLLVLPFTLMQSARKTKHAGIAASYARTAVSIEILMTCSIRRANLANLELGKNIKKIGLGKDAFWVIEFASEDVKNAMPLRFKLPKESAEILEAYLEKWRPHFCGQSNNWLFPNAQGGAPNARSLANAISRKSKQALGVTITPHQFRHLSASLYVGDDPNNLAVASEHLGHASVDTTRSYYLRSQQKAASRVYQLKLGLDRARAFERTTTAGSRRRLQSKFKKGDIL